jgi:hypothetical protein
MNSKYKAALLGVPLVVATIVCIASIISLGGTTLLEGSRIRYLAVLAGMVFTLIVSLASLKGIINLDRPAGLKPAIAFRYLNIKDTIRIIFLWACATISGMIIFGYFVSDDAGLMLSIVAAYIWFYAVQSLKCRAFFIHPEDRRGTAPE